MIFYNVTIKIALQIVKEWLEWQKHEHIPEVMSTGLFDDYKLFRLLEQDEEDGITFVIQYSTTSIERYRKYVENFSSHLRKKTVDKWSDQFVAFRTVMQIVN